VLPAGFACRDRRLGVLVGVFQSDLVGVGVRVRDAVVDVLVLVFHVLVFVLAVRVSVGHIGVTVLVGVRHFMAVLGRHGSLPHVFRVGVGPRLEHAHAPRSRVASGAGLWAAGKVMAGWFWAGDWAASGAQALGAVTSDGEVGGVDVEVVVACHAVLEGCQHR